MPTGPSPAVLRDLLERVRAAERSDPEIDARVHHALFPDQRMMLDAGVAFGPGPKHGPEYGTLAEFPINGWTDYPAVAATIEAGPYTASIDAALGLVERVLPDTVRPAFVQQPDRTWRAALLRVEPDTADSFHFDGATAPLAIVAALLSAKLTLLTQDAPDAE